MKTRASVSSPWPVNRKYPRYRMDTPMQALTASSEIVHGWCSDLGEGGLCATFAVEFTPGAELQLILDLPGAGRLLAHAIVRHANCPRFGFEFQDLSEIQRSQIRRFGLGQTTSAFLISSDAPAVRAIQNLLQHMGISQVSLGCPKVLPVPEPHLVVVDADWPDYKEVTAFLRIEATAGKMIMITMLGPDVPAEIAFSSGADLVIHKPVTASAAHGALETAFSMLRKPDSPVSSETRDASGSKVLSFPA